MFKVKYLASEYGSEQGQFGMTQHSVLKEQIFERWGDFDRQEIGTLSCTPIFKLNVMEEPWIKEVQELVSYKDGQASWKKIK